MFVRYDSLSVWSCLMLVGFCSNWPVMSFCSVLHFSTILCTFVGFSHRLVHKDVTPQTIMRPIVHYASPVCLLVFSSQNSRKLNCFLWFAYCSTGHYQMNEASTYCDECLLGSHQSSYGSSSCLPCQVDLPFFSYDLSLLGASLFELICLLCCMDFCGSNFLNYAILW